MSDDWVNRVGIVLNFCAGFLLAPELIGIQRLQRFETFLEESLKSYGDFVLSLLERVRSSLGESVMFAGCLMFFLTPGSLSLWAIWGVVIVHGLNISEVWLIATIAVACVAITALVAVVSTRMLRHSGQDEPGCLMAASSLALAVELGFLLLPLAILGVVCWVLVRVSAGLLSWVLGIILARLTGNERLKGVLVFAGVGAFIAGNALQLWATWLSDS